MTQEALRMAHKALIGLSIKHGEMTDEGMDAITAIEKALAKEKALQALHSENERLGLYKDAYAQPEQEPLAWYVKNNGEPLLGSEPSFYLEEAEETLAGLIEDSGSEIAPLYTHPQRTWVGLTDEEVRKICVNEWGGYEQCRAIEAKLKEKNT